MNLIKDETQSAKALAHSTEGAGPLFEPPSGVFVLGELWLWPGFAVSRPQYSQLLVADVHLGKAAHFRSLGVPVPDQVTEESLLRLSDLLIRSQAKSLVVLGDLIHDHRALSALEPLWAQWRELHAGIEIKLIVGNHDRRSLALLRTQRLTGLILCEEPYKDQSLWLAHEAKAFAGQVSSDVSPVLGLCGHEHPVISIPDRSIARRIRRPCFYLDHQHMLHLPAFGSFTGGHPVCLDDCKRIFVDTVDAVQELPLSTIRTRRRNLRS